VIRRATAGDAEAIARVEVRAFQHAYGDILDPGFLADMDLEERTAAWQRVLADASSAVWVAEGDGRIVGYASVRAGTLTTLYVDPVAQGAGIGTRLLTEAEAAGATDLEVFEANGHGRRFYEDRGWRDAGPAGEWLDRPLRRYVRP
jgi:ribosomal protein S18 acetylase RimI-like enzyme